MGVITAQEETLSGALPEISIHFDQHYDELSKHVGRYNWKCDFRKHFEAEAMGRFLTVTLREDGVVIGYFMGFIGPGNHYEHCLTLTMDLFFITPERRNVGAGAFKLFKKVEKTARARGVNLLLYGSKLHKDSGRLFRAFGMAPIETWYSKFLEN